MNRKDEALQALGRSAILDSLSDYSPTVVSTLLVGLDIEGSDIDVICCYPTQARFVEDLRCCCQQHEDFHLSVATDRVVASFTVDGFCIELFATEQAIQKQAAYQHFQVMQRLVELGGNRFTESVKLLKRKGLKTEPAIAQLLNLSGDPFAAVADLQDCNDAKLTTLLENAKDV